MSNRKSVGNKVFYNLTYDIFHRICTGGVDVYVNAIVYWLSGVKVRLFDSFGW